MGACSPEAPVCFCFPLVLSLLVSLNGCRVCRQYLTCKGSDFSDERTGNNKCCLLSGSVTTISGRRLTDSSNKQGNFGPDKEQIDRWMWKLLNKSVFSRFHLK